MTGTDFYKFLELAKNYRTIPVYQKVLADLLTPISAYMRLSQHSPYTFLFESVEKGTQYSRYSFIGIQPDKIIKQKNGKTTIEKDGDITLLEKPFLEILRDTLQKYSVPKIPGIPKFTGGLVGYMGYETVRWFENIPVHSEDDLNVPDAVFMLFEDLLAFDHLTNEVIVLSNVNVDQTTDLKIAYDNAMSRIDKIGKDLHTDINYQIPSRIEKSKVFSNIDADTFKLSVEKAKDYIKKGDILQIVLSQKFHRFTSAESLTVYRALRTINPSPYMFHLKMKDFEIIGASPEILVKVENRMVEIRPIAGTRPRGKDEEQDSILEKDLLSDEKERAEHLMLVDLGRNDVGRVAKSGSVKVEEYGVIEKYSHVMHIVSGIKGQLKNNKDVFDALISGFPAGTTCGAPKIRAMELIYELEPDRRNIYSGVIGYIDFSGDMNTCIAIRTLVMKDGIVYFQSGAGIVYDSKPEKEYQETVHKAKAIMKAIDLAEGGLTVNPFSNSTSSEHGL